MDTKKLFVDFSFSLQRPPPSRPYEHETLVFLQTTVNQISCYYGHGIYRIDMHQ